MNSLVPSVLTTERLSKSYGSHVALADLDLDLPRGAVVGLLGRNGAGKTTLLHVAAGLVPPTAGVCRTLGRRSDELERGQLEQIGLVMQEGRFIEWMTPEQHFEFTASFYPRWDFELQQRLVATLELPVNRKLASLSPGDRQKASVILGVCHHPALLILDEPMSALDPIARSSLLGALVERLREDACTIVISSHLLSDVEKIVDWVVALNAGRLVESAAFDDLQEAFAEWTVTAPADRLLPDCSEPFILDHKASGRMARLLVRVREPEAAAKFAADHQIDVQARPLNLDEMFPLLVGAPSKP